MRVLKQIYKIYKIHCSLLLVSYTNLLQYIIKIHDKNFTVKFK